MNNEEAPTLEPCPFHHRVVSGVAIVSWDDEESIAGRFCVAVECYDCQVSGETFCIDKSTTDAKRIAEEKAVAAWNTRSDLPRTDVEGAARAVVKYLQPYDLGWGINEHVEKVGAIISKHCSPAPATECLMADCSKPQEHFCFEHCVEVYGAPATGELIECPWCRAHPHRQACSERCQRARDAVQPAASCGCRAVVEKKAAEYQRQADSSLKDDDTQAWFRGEAHAANEILAVLPAPSEVK